MYIGNIWTNRLETKQHQHTAVTEGEKDHIKQHLTEGMSTTIIHK